MENLLKLKNAGSYNGIEHRVCELHASPQFNPKLKILSKFFYLKFKNNRITEAEFAKFAYDKIVRFCIPREKFNDAFNKCLETKDERYLNDIHDLAKSLFVRSLKKTGAHLGEPGELIAFIILEHFFNAPQIACKMFLKTNSKMPVHGADSVHIKIDENSGKMDLIWGESKLYKNISDAFDNSLTSIGNFLGKNSSDTEHAPKIRDIEIIKSMPNVESQLMKDELCNYFDPYKNESNMLNEKFFCFIGFDYELYKNIDNIKDNELEDYFKNKYLEKIIKEVESFSSKIVKNKLIELEFILALLPFESVENFRNEFFKHLSIIVGGGDD